MEKEKNIHLLYFKYLFKLLKYYTRYLYILLYILFLEWKIKQKKKKVYNNTTQK